MLKVAFAGAFAARLVEAVRGRLTTPCDMTAGDEVGIVSTLIDADVLVSMVFSSEMAKAAPRLRLLQVPGAGLDRIDRSVLRAETRLANVYGHETGIAEYVIGAMLSFTRSFGRLDRKLRRGEWESQWAVAVQHSASSDTVTSDKRSRGGREPSRWMSAQSGGTRQNCHRQN